MTPAEMKEIDCANFLVNTFGMLDKHIDTDFEAIDKNGDGVVSKEESERSERMPFFKLLNSLRSKRQMRFSKPRPLEQRMFFVI